MGVGIDDRAPDFDALDSNGGMFHLSEAITRGPVVLFFYPKDDSPGCTAEACAFRDAYQDFVEAGVTVIGVSGDSIDSHKNFADRHRLPFLLITDPKGEIRRLFGVPKTLGIFPGRATYVIDEGGIVRHIFVSQLRVTQHVTEALKLIADSAG